MNALQRSARALARAERRAMERWPVEAALAWTIGVGVCAVWYSC